MRLRSVLVGSAAVLFIVFAVALLKSEDRKDAVQHEFDETTESVRVIGPYHGITRSFEWRFDHTEQVLRVPSPRQQAGDIVPDDIYVRRVGGVITKNGQPFLQDSVVKQEQAEVILNYLDGENWAREHWPNRFR